MGKRETSCKYGAVLNCLGAALDRCGKERMGRIPEQTSEAIFGDPGREWISVYEFPVDA